MTGELLSHSLLNGNKGLQPLVVFYLGGLQPLVVFYLGGLQPLGLISGMQLHHKGLKPLVAEGREIEHNLNELKPLGFFLDDEGELMKVFCIKITANINI